ncbi:transposable element Tcb1 transposase [Trichonephila clavipes]|nr:transposable element Tcb1 transposase [Trichonephila clavipes]
MPLHQFERWRIIGMMEAGGSARRVARQLGRSDCVVGSHCDQCIREMHLAEGDLKSRRALRVLPLTPTHRRLRLEWCRARGNWTAAECYYVVFSDESRFNLSSDDNRVRVWRPGGELLNPAVALQRHTSPTARLMVWGAIAYNTRSPLVLIRGTMTVQRYVDDIQPATTCVATPATAPIEALFNKTMLGVTRQGCHKTIPVCNLYKL